MQRYWMNIPQIHLNALAKIKDSIIIQRLRKLVVILSIIVPLFVILMSYPSLAADKIVLVGSEDTKDSSTGRWLNLIYTEVFRRLGYEFEYRGYPNERANIMAESGIVDGEIQRAANYEKVAKNLLKVEEPSFSVNVAAYAITPGIVLDGWESLKNTNYIVEYRRGSKVPQNALPPVVKPENISTTTTVEQGLIRLILGRIDIYIEQEHVFAETIRKFDRDTVDPSSVYQAGILWTGESHVYLHKKNAVFLQKIAEVLKSLKQEGKIEHYREISQNAH